MTQHHGLWEERWHPLREEWIIVAAHRQNRPWIGQTVTTLPPRDPDYDPSCYLCPSNMRVSGHQNPAYTGVYVFDNDHPCVGPLAPPPATPAWPYRARRADGIARVICFSPAHNQTLAEMTPAAITDVVQVWQQQTYDLGQRPEVNHVLCFENKGAVVGVSNPHPHGQVYATNFVFKTMETELFAAQRFWHDHNRVLMHEIITAEQQDARRILYEDDHTIAFVPYFARYAYEVYVVPKRTVTHLYALSAAESQSLAQAISAVTIRFDNLWQMSFPYVLSIHQAPTDGSQMPFFHAFLAFHPPLRRPELLKYLAGPEIGGGNFLSDTAPEVTAAALQAVAPIHFRAHEVQ
ncbi:MAG: galactose-1-phosphate uridylyltransferase [Chloroflexia bacterium]|nr:galactose-1-phosphate uridylyltransferase [Chloroflexia bacterium]